jgi:geranylgeranyl diphosphate synthase, type II
MAMQGCTLEADLVSLRELVHARLETYVLGTAASDASGCPDTLREAMAYSLLAGGKRLRPVLVLLACEACGGSIEAALPAACAIEMIHTYSLIHDDLPAMDDDDYRRGRLTNHKVFGEAMAILAGDALLTLAFEVIARDTQPGSVAAACCADLASAAGWCGMVAGQVADIEGESREGVDGRGLMGERKEEDAPAATSGSCLSSLSSRPTEEPLTLTLSPQSRGEGTRQEATLSPDQRSGDARPSEGTRPPLTLTLSPQSRGEGTRQEAILDARAASLAQLEEIHRRKTGRLLCSAVTLGARVAQADAKLVNRLEEFGNRVGLAFQIADDLLDVTGDAAKLGKGVGKDATLGKMTYPALLGVEESRRKADALIDEACQLLKPLGERGQKLIELARFVTQRDH